MSQENVERMRAAYDAIWKRGDVDAALVDVAEDIVWVTPQNPEGAIRSGREEVSRFFRDVLDTFEVVEAEYDFVDRGDRIVVAGRFRGRGKRSGAEVEAPIGQVWTLREGKAVRMEWYATPEKALEAAGLSE